MAWVRTSLSVCVLQSARDDGARQGIESVIPNAPAGCRSGLPQSGSESRRRRFLRVRSHFCGLSALISARGLGGPLNGPGVRAR